MRSKHGRCFECKGKMKIHTIPRYNTCWGEERFTIENVEALKCSKCDAISFTGEQVRIIERRSDEIMMGGSE